MESLKNVNVYDKCKKIVKVWECNFMKSNGRPPSKLDIREADKKVRDAYSTYFKIKTAALEESLMDILDDDNNDDCNNYDSTEKSESNINDQNSSVSHNDTITTDELNITENHSMVKEDTEQIWGEHLNKTKDLPKEPKISSIRKNEMNASFTKKLFVNSKFMKRNPRRSQILNSSKLNSSDTESLSQSVMSSEKTESKEETITNFNSTLPVTSSSGIAPSKSVNIISQILNDSVDAPVRRVNKGWLQRVTENTGKDFADSEMNKFDSGQDKLGYDSDDIISDSDNDDSVSVFHISKRIKLSHNTNETAVTSTPVLNFSNIFTSKNTEAKVIEPNIIPKVLLTVDKSIEDKLKLFNENNVEKTEIVEKNCNDNNDIKLSPEKKLVVESESDSDYEEPKPARKRKRNPETVKKPTKTKKVPTKRQTRGKGKKSDETEKEPEINDKNNETEEYEVEYSIKPPPKTVPRFKNLVLEAKTELNTTETKGDQQVPTKQQNAKSKLMKKIESGTLNENFVRLDIKKKVYVRGKKNMNFSKYKKQQWKNKKKALYGPDMDMGGCDGGELVCFKCGKTGHFARKCKNQAVDKLLPLEAAEEEECLLPSLEEASKMARESVLAVRIPNLVANPQTSDSADESPAQTLNEDTDCNSEFDDDAELESFMLNTEISENIPHTISNSQAQLPQKWIEALEEKVVKPLYDLNDDGSIQDTPNEVFEALKEFGHSSFRSGQEQAVMRILSGLSTLVTLSTGSGKSLCYQLPAYLYAKKKNCISLVISPLVSLMEDQVSGIPNFLKAACLHTAQTETQKNKVLAAIEAGDLNVLLVSPEAVTAGEKKSGFGSMLRKLPPIAFACIDEAHCVSQWSHNFRPSYLVICRVLRERLGIKTVLGLTATSTHATSSSIVKHLQIPDGQDGVISDIPLPDNLFLSVSRDMQRDAALKNLLMSDPFDGFDSIIVYCTRREECERIASQLRTSIRVQQTSNSVKKYKSLSPIAEPYHAGLPASKRRTVQNAFMGGYLRIVVATVAFGMGINKANIRGVIHYNMPRNFESYVQEVGRAGRDGLPAHCHLFLDAEGRDQYELRRHIFANSMDRHAIRKLLQKIFVPCGCKKNCPRHEVAFSVEDTVKLLDVPEENISTLLCYLELHEKRYLEVLTPVYTVCKVISYGGNQSIKKATQDCAPLAMAFAMQKNNGQDLSDNVFEFPVVDVAAAMGWDSGIVKSKLKNLEWIRENNMPKRSKLTIEFSNLGFHLRTPGNLSSAELDEALDSLYAKKKEQETTSLQQLQVVHTTLSAVAEQYYHLCLTEDYALKSKQLKTKIREYFSCEEPLKDVEIECKELKNEAQIIADVRNLVAMYRDNNFTGRAVARIFHGIQSPNYPAVIWGRCKFWRAHLNSDFNKVCQICTAEILKLR